MRKKELKESCFYWYEKYEEIYFKYSIEKHENNNLQQENKELKERINKAIEYIENMYGNEIEFNFKREQLLEILKGED